MHEGHIGVGSAGEGRGSVFTLRLPLATATETDSTAEHALRRAPAGSPAARVLIVDDNADAAESLAMLLAELGHVTAVVTDSTQATAVALDFKPDVVFLDIGMPQLNGFDLARQMRGHRSLKNVYLAALSGWGTEQDRAKSIDAGIDRHLTKPVSIEEVQEMLLSVPRVSMASSAPPPA